MYERMLRRFLYAFLGFNFMVIVWGAWVRISFSGDGCGNSWPLCAGEFIPSAVTRAPWIEWAHRASTGIFGLLAVGLFVAGYRAYPKGHPIRRPLAVMLLLTFAEALIGAALVKLELVSQDASVARAWVMGVHQLTSLTLTGSIFLSALRARPTPFAMTCWRSLFPIVAIFAFASFSGAIAALAGTLFPSADLISGILADFDANSHPLVRLRLAHPLLAGVFSVAAGIWSARRGKGLALVVFGIAFAFGLATLLALSPVWMKLTHLALAHVAVLALLAAGRREGRAATACA